MDVFTQEIANVIQKTLCPNLDKITTKMTCHLATVKSSRKRTTSEIQPKAIQNEIEGVFKTAKKVYDDSDMLLKLCKK